MARVQDELESEDANLIDFKLILNYVGFAFGSIRRRKRFVLFLFTMIFCATVGGLFVMPRTYHVETKILVQRNQALAVHGDAQGEAPTRGAVETIMRRDNLVAIIHQTDLLHQWYVTRAPILRLKDIIVRAVTRLETEQETIEWMADVMEKKMAAWTTEGVVGISIDWPDPSMALRLVDTAENNYLESRRATEITAIAEQVSILNTHADALRKDIDAAVADIEKLRAERGAAKNAPTAAVPESSAPRAIAVAAAPRRSSEPDAELVQLKALIEAKQRAITDLETSRRNRLNDLNATLAEKRATLTENHPIIIDLRQTIASLSTESPQVQSLRTELAGLQKEFDSKSAQAVAESRAVPVISSGGGSTTPPPLPGSIIRIEQESLEDREPGMVYARTTLKDAMDKYSQLRAQIETAQIDEDTAKAAFKYRYNIIDPPLFPKKPSKPNAPLVLIAGLVGGLFVSMFAAVTADIRRGRFVERWQVERALDLPILSEVDMSALAKHKIE